MELPSLATRAPPTVMDGGLNRFWRIAIMCVYTVPRSVYRIVVVFQVARTYQVYNSWSMFNGEAELAYEGPAASKTLNASDICSPPGSLTILLLVRMSRRFLCRCCATTILLLCETPPRIRSYFSCKMWGGIPSECAFHGKYRLPRLSLQIFCCRIRWGFSVL